MEWIWKRGGEEFVGYKWVVCCDFLDLKEEGK